MPYKVDMHSYKCQAEPTDVLTAYATDAEGFCGFAFRFHRRYMRADKKRRALMNKLGMTA